MLTTRQREPEIMDDPLLDRREHERALRGLSRLNCYSGSVWALWQPIRRLAQKLNRKELRILDIATGSADNPISLWELGQRAGYELQIDGCDVSDTALEHARTRAAKANAPSTFFNLDATKGELPHDYDVIMSSLFAHHLSEEEVVAFLAKMRASSKHLVVLNDLVRSVPSLVMVSLATQMLTRSQVVHFDGPASVRASFTPEELKKLAKEAGLTNATVYEQFPCRMMLVCRSDG